MYQPTNDFVTFFSLWLPASRFSAVSICFSFFEHIPREGTLVAMPLEGVNTVKWICARATQPSEKRKKYGHRWEHFFFFSYTILVCCHNNEFRLEDPRRLIENDTSVRMKFRIKLFTLQTLRKTIAWQLRKIARIPVYFSFIYVYMYKIIYIYIDI